MSGTAGASSPLRFTTGSVAQTDRRPLLHELRDRGLLPVEPLPGRAPRVDLVKWHMPGASILAGTFCGVRQRSGPGLPGADDLFFGINLSGRSLVTSRAGEVEVGAGQAVAIDPDAGSFDVVRRSPARMIGVRLPRDRGPVEAARASTHGLRLVPAEAEGMRLLIGYLRAALATGLPASAPLADAFVSHLTELIVLSLDPAWSGTPSPADESVRVARLAAIKADIARGLTGGPLSAASVAAAHGISTRYLHRLFETEGTTFGRFVLAQRLAFARRRLLDPRYAGRTVAAIAMDSGFGDLSYFNRTFRRVYGTTPSDVRRG